MSVAPRRAIHEPLQRKPSNPGKLGVVQPTSIRQFSVFLVMHLCRKLLLIDTFWKLLYYACLISVVSLITDLVPFPKTYFSRKNNSLNVCFVKLGMGWTLIILSSFMAATSYVYTLGNEKLVRRIILRLGLVTFFWYIWTGFFDYIEDLTGFCSSGTADEHPHRPQCVKEGYNWVAFDVSGHAFLLIHCLLTISEEVKCIESWDKIPELHKLPDQKLGVAQPELEKLNDLYKKYTPYVRVATIAVTILQLIFEVMLVATCLYFHNMPQKVTGGAFACFSWLLTYQFAFKDEMIEPGPTGKGLLKYIKSQHTS